MKLKDNKEFIAMRRYHEDMEQFILFKEGSIMTFTENGKWISDHEGLQISQIKEMRKTHRKKLKFLQDEEKEEKKMIKMIELEEGHRIKLQEERERKKEEQENKKEWKRE